VEMIKTRFGRGASAARARNADEKRSSAQSACAVNLFNKFSLINLRPNVRATSMRRNGNRHFLFGLRAWTAETV